MVATNVPPAVGGPASQFVEMVSILQDTHELHIVLPFVKLDLEARLMLEDQGVTFYQVVKGKTRIHEICSLVSLLLDLCGSIRFSNAFIQTWNNIFNPLIMVILRHNNVKIAIKLTGFCSQENEKSSMIGYVRSRILDLCNTILVHKIWVTTKSFKEQVGCGISKKNIVVHPNFVSEGFFKRSSRAIPSHTPRSNSRIKIITIARLKPWKGLNKCIEVFSRLNGEKDLDWVIIGEGASDFADSFRRNLSDVRELSNNSITLVESFGQTEIISQLKGADFFVLLSDYEPFGIVLLEAMALNCRIIASSVGGIPEVLGDGSRGVLVEPNDLQAVVELIQAYPKNMNLWNLDGARFYSESLKPSICVPNIFRDLLF